MHTGVRRTMSSKKIKQYQHWRHFAYEVKYRLFINAFLQEFRDWKTEHAVNLY